MIRTARYLSHLVWQYLLGALGAAAVLIALQALATTPDSTEHAAGYLTGLAFSMALLFPLLVQLSLVPVYFPLCLSMGATRRGLWGGAQIVKIHIALGFSALFELVQLAVQGLFHTEVVFYGPRLVGVCLAVLLCAALGETFGLAGLRFGRKGLVTMMILLGLLSGAGGGLIGFLAAGGHVDGMLDVLLRALEQPVSLGVSAAAAVVLLAVADWLLCRRIAAK